MIFSDRKQAGRLLGEKLIDHASEEVMIAALPRGGVPVAAEIARMLQAPLEVLIVRKVGAMFQPELAVGAMCEDQDPIWSRAILSQTGLVPDDLDQTVRMEFAKIKRQTLLFRDGRKFPDVRRKTVIVVDDGLATGATMIAAVRYLRKKEADRIIVAVPVAAASSSKRLREEVDDFIVLQEREDLLSVGQWYRDFSEVEDEEVLTDLKELGSGEKWEGTREVAIPLGDIELPGDLTTFADQKALIIFAHGSGSSRKSPRNQQVAEFLHQNGFGTLLFDLLTDDEAADRKNVFDITFLSDRLISVSEWLREQPGLRDIPFGYFGASTGAAAALRAAASSSGQENIYAVVSRGGRPDLAGESLRSVMAQTLLIVGGQDFEVIDLNRQAHEFLENSQLAIVPGASHLFEEPGTLEEVCRLAASWFEGRLPTETRALRQSDIQDHHQNEAHH